MKTKSKALALNNRGVAGDMDNNIHSVTLIYEDSTGSFVEEPGLLNLGVATFSGLDLYVSATGLKAVGQTSGKTATNWTGSAPSRPNVMHVYETKPTLALSSSSPSGSRSVSAADDAFIFTVTADSNEKVVIKNPKVLLSSDAEFDTASAVVATLKESGSSVSSAKRSFTDSSNASVQFNFTSTVEVAAGSTETLLIEDSGIDDPLTFSIKLGSSSNGTVSPGGLKWNDTNADVTWVGNVNSTTLTGNTLLY